MADDADAGSDSTAPASTRPRGRGPWLVVLAVAALLVLAAVMVPDGFALLRRRETGRFVLPDVPALLRYVVMGLAVAMVLVGLWGVVLSAKGVGFARRRTWEAKVLVLFVAVGLIGLGFILVPLLHRDRSPTPPTLTPAPPTPPPTEAADAFLRSTGFGVLLTVLVLGAIVLGLLAWGRSWSRARPGRALDESLRRGLAEDLDRGIAEVARIEDPRAAVIACYARMERTVEAAGVARTPADAPFELLAKVLEREHVPAASARRLTELFERARFSDHEVSPVMREEALGALTDVRAGLSISP
jgi:hypothetical protein